MNNCIMIEITFPDDLKDGRGQNPGDKGMAVHQDPGCQPEEVLWQAMWSGLGWRVWCRQDHLLQAAAGGEVQLKEAHLAEKQDDSKLHLPK